MKVDELLELNCINNNDPLYFYIFKVFEEKINAKVVGGKKVSKIRRDGNIQRSNLIYLPTDGADNGSVYHKATLQFKFP